MLTVKAAYAQKTFDLEPFDAVAASGNFEVILKAGDSEKAFLEVQNAPQDEVSIKVVRGELRINFLNSLIYKNYDVKVTVYYKTLRTVRGIAGARIVTTEALHGDMIELRAASGAQLDLAVNANAIEGSAVEGGMLRIKGATQTQRASATTGGQYEAFELQSQRTYVRASLGGHAQVAAIKALEAVAHTGGSIEYRGDPEENNVRNIISGDIRKSSGNR